MVPTKISVARNLTSSNRAFSLLELMVVLVLVALVSATVIVKWSGVRQGATLDAAIGQLEFTDAHMRRYARSHGTACSLSFDLKGHRLRKQYQSRTRRNPPWVPLGRGITIKRLDSTAEKPTRKQFDLTIKPNGTSATYGLQLAGAGEQQAWLIVAGVSGQITRLASASEYQDAFQILSPKQ